jgi:RNA polymerase-binding transcription factor DksA
MTAEREVLLARLETLLGREQKIATHLRGEDGRREADFGDVPSYTAADEVLEGLEAAALTEIREIHAALERLDTGTYGACERCGGPIAPERLAVLPHARLCVGCAGKLAP